MRIVFLTGPNIPASASLGQSPQCLSCRDFVGMDPDHLLLVGADPAPVAHEAHGSEQIALDHEAVEAPDALNTAKLVLVSTGRRRVMT
jgi:hypothetical protein